jgi:hypothetical protein
VIPLFLVNRHIRAISSFHESSVSASVWNALKGAERSRSIQSSSRPASGRQARRVCDLMFSSAQSASWNQRPPLAGRPFF